MSLREVKDELNPGDVVSGRYRIDARIGSGGMGTVYAATHLALDRLVALKVLKAERSWDAADRRSFEREARVCARMRHPSAVEIFDYGSDGDCLYLVMEYLEGATLRHAMNRAEPVIEQRRALAIARQVADVLVAAHGISLVHRDLKPENIVLVPGGDGAGDERAVVVDFGLAFLADDPGLGRQTRSGITKGTPEYLAPEQARGVAVGSAADIYALGVVLFEMLTDVRPFMRTTVLDTLNAHLYLPVPSPGEARADVKVPARVIDLVMRMLAKTPFMRPNAEEVRSDLDRALAAPPLIAAHALNPPTDRAARMIQTPVTAQLPTSLGPAMTDRTIGISGGAPADELVVALAAAGWTAVVLDPARPAAQRLDAIFAPEAEGAGLRALLGSGRPVIASASPDDVERIAELARAGVAEVVGRPVRPDELIRKLSRAIRVAERRR